MMRTDSMAVGSGDHVNLRGGNEAWEDGRETVIDKTIQHGGHFKSSVLVYDVYHNNGCLYVLFILTMTHSLTM
jgi:hypothetical protein